MSKQDHRTETAADTTEQTFMTPRGESMETVRVRRGITERAIEGDVHALAPSVSDKPGRLAVGLLAIVVGLAGVFGLVALPEVPAPVVIINTLSVLALLVGSFLLARRLLNDTRQADTADVEYRESVTVPGVDFDRVLHGAVHGMGSQRINARQEIIERVASAATLVYAQAERLELDEAKERIQDGSWTTNEVAAEFLATSGEGISPTSDLVRTLIGRTSELSARVDQVGVELAALAPGIDFSTATDDDHEHPDRTDTTDFQRVETDRRTGRWRGLTGLALLTISAGLFTSTTRLPPSLIVSAAAIVGTAGYVYISDPPETAASVSRTLSTDEATPGDEVVVTVTVTNEGDAILPDLRIVDGVPPELTVVDGSPRYATALRAGESVKFAYTVRANRGQHVFEPAHLISRDFSGAVERERHVDAEEVTVLSCPLELVADQEVPVHPHTARRVGRVDTDTGGSGVELHSVREYRRGDPLNRVDWNRLASTGEFATLQFREEHAATVVLLLDARAEAYAAPDVDAPSALEWELEAADVMLSSLISAGDSVGVAALSPEWCWLQPRGGRSQLARARNLLETHPAFDGRRPEGAFHGGIEERRLRRELPADAQLVLFSPLCDDDAVEIARGLHARDYPVTVISPDVTAAGSTGQRLAAIERAIRISRLRRSNIRVIDWDTDAPLQAAMEAAERRWSA